MAFQTITTSRENSWKVNLMPGDILGREAYGVVYTAEDSDNRQVAAKRIDGRAHPGILEHNFDKLLGLKHPNIVNIFDIQEQDQTLWMFMEFCPHGDLNKFFQENVLSFHQKLDVMKQISNGLHYLHTKNIIHRDIKPPNILMSRENSLVPKLTDFDVAKCLDPDVETSVMSSNVGTLACKAPEFFKKSEHGKISYHRNVDIFALGLTFLAVFQAKKGKRMLVPHMETARDSEHMMPIGSVIVTRISYNISNLSIVDLQATSADSDTTDQDAAAAADQESVAMETRQKLELKKLIQKMTCFKPEERLSASDVLDILRRIIANDIDDQLHGAVASLAIAQVSPVARSS